MTTSHTNAVTSVPVGTQIVLLGTGTPNAEPERHGSAVAIIVNHTPYIIDCGAGVVRRASAAFEQGIRALEPSNLKHLFITHLHSDHTVGYPDLILTPWTLGRDEPLVVHGPVGTRSMTDHLLHAYQEDIRIRTTGDEPANHDGYRVDVTEIQAGRVYEDRNVKVTAFHADHGSWEHAYGFRFETPDRTIVISGDTTPTQTLIDNAIGCDVLIHEVYSQTAFERRSPEWQRYHAASHTSAVQLAQLANRVKPGLLILYHQLYWGTTDAELLDEVRKHYTGKVVSGKDLEVY